MGVSSSTSKRQPANLPENWQVGTLRRIEVLGDFLYKRELEYQRRVEKGEPQAPVMLANVKLNIKILPTVEVAVRRLVDGGQIVECPEIDLIESILLRFEAEPARTLSDNEFEALTKVTRAQKRFFGC